MNINGISFEYLNKVIPYKSGYGSLFNAYSKPSTSKRYIWFKWQRFVQSVNGSDFRVLSRNCFIFTIGFDFVNPETGERMRAKITPTHNYCSSI